MVEITRVSTLSVQTRAISNFNRVQGNLANLQDQLSSGLKGRTFQDYNGQVEQLTSLEKEVARLQMYIENNAETRSRLKTIESTLQQVQALGDDVKELMTLRNNPTFANNISYDVQIKNLREAIAKELNVNIEGRYLLGGTRTDVPPVIVEPYIPETVEEGVADDAYYQGGQENVVARLQDNSELEMTVRADNEAFQKLFGAISFTLTAHEENNQEKLNAAQDMMDEALAGVNSLTARVRADYVDIDNITVRQKDTKLYFTGLADDIAKADVVAVASEVAIDESILSATFQVFARISSLKLSDFL